MGNLTNTYLALFLSFILELEPPYPGVGGHRAKAYGLVSVSAQNKAEVIGFPF